MLRVSIHQLEHVLALVTSRSSVSSVSSVLVLEDLRKSWSDSNILTRCKFCRPHVEDLKEPPMLIVQLHPQLQSFGVAPKKDESPARPARISCSARCPHHFALVDAVGIQIINYEGPTEFHQVPPDFTAQYSWFSLRNWEV